MESIVNWPGWEFVRKLGAGSYGAVYEIRQQIGSLERRAALKVIPVPRDENELNDLVSQGYDDETIERSLREQIEDVVREFSVMLDLRECPNIVHCEDLRIVDRPEGEKGKDICMQMELLTPLTRALKPGEEASQVIRIARDMLSALAFCRKLKIVHRDIKPQNIFVSRDGDYKLGDFGVARTMDRTGSATMIGTLNYMAPEVHSGAHYGSSADVYSLGLVLYWLLNERHLPFVPILDRPAKQSEVEQAMSRRLRGESILFPKNGSVELRRLVCSMCAYRPEDRPSLEALQAAFDRLANPSGTRTQPKPQPQPAAPVKTSPKPAPAPIPEEEEGTIGVWEAKRTPVQNTPPAQKTRPATPPERAPEPEREYAQWNAATVTEKSIHAKAEAARAAQTPQKPSGHIGRIIGIVAAVIVALLALGYFTIHVYEPATCTSPQICKICGRASGEALGHSPGAEATCTSKQVCTRCGKTLKEALGHDWAAATYDTPKTCRRCGLTEGNLKGYHSDDEIHESWSEEKVKLDDGSEGCYKTLNGTTIHRCFRMTIQFGITEVSRGYPYGTMSVYVRDSSGNWKQAGSFQTDESALVGSSGTLKAYVVNFSSDVDFDAYKVSFSGDDYNYNYRCWMESYQVRED